LLDDWTCHPAEPFLRHLQGLGLLDGVFSNPTIFDPNEPVTRVELARLFARVFSWLPPYSSTQPSETLSVADSDAAVIQQAIRQGFLRKEPFPASPLSSATGVSRGELLESLATAFSFVPPPQEQIDLLDRFHDAGSFPRSEKVRHAWAIAVLNGLVVSYPYPYILDPNSNLTRAEAAVMVYQARRTVPRAEGQLPAVSSAYLVTSASLQAAPPPVNNTRPVWMCIDNGDASLLEQRCPQQSTGTTTD